MQALEISPTLPLFFSPYHFRMIAGVLPFLLQLDAFIASKVDYCNALFSDLAKEVFKIKRQIIQTAASLLLVLEPFTRACSWFSFQSLN